MCVVLITVTKNKLYCRQGYLLVQNVDCRLQNALSADRIQNVDCRLQSGYKMQTENLKCFFVWYVINYILQLTERHVIAFLRSASTIICTIVEYSWPVS